MKKIITSFLVCLMVFVGWTSAASAKDLGVVDLNKVLENYTKAQEVSADLKVKEAELQKFVLDAQEQIKKAETPVEKENLEKKLGEQFNIKRNAFAKEQTEKWQEIENDVYEKIKEISEAKKLEMVLNKQSVIVGGIDITEEVVKQLNEEASSSKKKTESKDGVFGIFK